MILFKTNILLGFDFVFHLYPFPLLCGVYGSYASPPFNPVMLFLLAIPIRQVAPGAIQPPSVLMFLSFFSPAPPSPSAAYHHILLFSSQCISMPLQSEFLHFLGYGFPFAVLLIISFLILSTTLIHLNIIINFQTHSISYIVLSSLLMSLHRTPLQVFVCLDCRAFWCLTNVHDSIGNLRSEEHWD